MIKPLLEQEFKPAIIELRKFNEDVKKEKEKTHLIVCVERDGGYIYRKEFDCFKDGVDDDRNYFMVERIIKTILWVVGGFKIYIAGSHKIYVCHGHQYGVGANRFRLKNEARLRGCDIVIYGHTHVLDIDNSDPDVLCINPGSLLNPRDFGSPSYVAMSIDEQNRVSCNAFRVDF